MAEKHVRKILAKYKVVEAFLKNFHKVSPNKKNERSIPFFSRAL